MFKNLPTGTKLLILCGVFAIIVAVPIYDLITEKQVAIDVTRKELAGTRYLAALQGIYAAMLTSQLSDRPTGQPESTDKALKALMAAEAESANTLQTAELEQALTDTLHELWSPKAARPTIDTYLVDALALARHLISRVGDDSKLAIDPELDSYYLQSIAVLRLPSLMGQLGETHTLFRTAAAAGALSSEREVRLLMLDGLLRSTAAGVKDDLAAAYRGNNDGALKGIVDSDIETMVMTTAYI
jgi:hypothetical protein